MAIKYRVNVIESEAGWGQSHDSVFFDTAQAAIAYRDNINSKNTKEVVPDWYMVAEQEIVIVER